MRFARFHRIKAIKFIALTKAEEDLEKFFEVLRKYGIGTSTSVVTRCG